MRKRKTRLDDNGKALLIVLLDHHDGDDKCGCLRAALLEAILANDHAEALDLVLSCEWGHSRDAS